MRKIILGNFKNNKVFRKKLRSSYRQAVRILRPQFGDNKGYDLVFCRKIWTYSDDGVDFYRRQNHMLLLKFVRFLEIFAILIFKTR